MNEFEAYVNELMNSAAVNSGTKQASVDAPEAAPAAQAEPAAAVSTQPPVTPEAKTATAADSNVAEAISQANANLPEDLKKTADALAFMEAYTSTKQANYMKDQVSEALMNNYGLVPQYAVPQQAQPKQASAEEQAYADAVYKQAAAEAEFVKVASEAQAFVDTLFADEYQRQLANEAALWDQVAHQQLSQKGY